MVELSTTSGIRDLAPPGEILQEALEERGISNAELARRTGLSEKHVSQLVNSHVSLSMDVALKLERVLGIPANFWLALESNFRSEQKREEQRQRLKDFAEWMRQFPIAAMRKAGYFGDAVVGQDVVSRVEALLQFFGVTTPDAWEREWSHATGRFRKSSSFDPDRCALTAWLRRGELEAHRIRCAPFDEARFNDALAEARGLTTTPPEVFGPRLSHLCANAGVALILVPSLPKLAISGVARWIGPQKAVICLSLRHRSDDQLWFSFFHEACHVLEHRTGTIYIDAAGDPDGNPDEQRANQFARDVLIPPDDFRRLSSKGKPSLAEIQAFAGEIGVAPGIVVGRLQFEGLLPHNHGNRLKQWIQWDFEQ